MQGVTVGEPTQQEGDPAAVIALLRQFSVATDQYVESIRTANATHRTHLNALAVIMDTARAGTPATPGHLSKSLNLSSPATTALIDRMEAAGHVKRIRSTTDRRKVELELTSTARDLGTAMFAPLGREIQKALTAYQPHELALVERFLSDVIAATARASSPEAATAALPR